MQNNIINSPNKISIGEYTQYRMSVERILTGAYMSALSLDQELAMFMTSYLVHSYLEGRSATECAMKIKDKFPLDSGA